MIFRSVQAFAAVRWALALPVALLLALATVPAALAAEPKVVVTLKPVHALVARVMQGAGTPLLIVDGAASPHTFSLKPSGARAINEADVFFRVSEALEPFTHKVADALPASVRLVSLADAPGVVLLDQRSGDTFDAHGGAHDDHGAEHGGAKDNHIWLDPQNAKAIVAQVAKTLGAVYPENAGKYNANASAVSASLDALSADIAADLAAIKGKPFIVFHDATQYFEKRFGLQAAGSVTVSPDVQPSAKRLTAVRKKIAELGAVCVFAEPGFQPKLIAAVTEGTKARAGTLDPEGMVLSPGPDLYDNLMRTLAKSVSTCLAGPADSAVVK
ncbi:MAG: zinc ABC transporter solute-binding protein [Hyphomicrobium sp.]|nr:zinc ABC transporter solute-binding protein [Hyphomicrobium sp.]